MRCSIATVTAQRDSGFSGPRCGEAQLPWRLLMPFRTSYLRMKADEYRAFAAMTDGAIRLQLLNMAERYNREAEQNERQHQRRADKATTSY